MGGSREASPDWLRAFQAPTQSITTLSSDSELSGDKSPAKDNSTDFNKDMKLRSSNTLEADEEEDEKICSIALKSPNKKATKKIVGGVTPAKRKRTIEHENGGSVDVENVKSEKYLDKSTDTSASAPNPSVFELSSDSDSKSDATVRKKKKKIDDEESVPRSTVKGKSPNKRMKQEDVQLLDKRKADKPVNIKGNNDNTEVAEDSKPEKQTEPAVNSSTLPLVLPEKVHRSKALVECEGESIDLSGDMGAVGRVIISKTPSKESEMFLDLKGTIYKTTIVPSRTFCVVSIGQSEAKIEAIMNDFIQLKPQSNVYDAETMVEGTLEGFTFDSDEEPEKMTKEVKGDQNEGAEEKTNKKAKGKVEKKSVKSPTTKKKGKDVGAKQPKKRKPQAPKKGKAKK
ncbi:DNA-binding protein BIN4 isoform X2 [Amaranthus tricolor]|uniref:DNA-binding protein BIN4 isoform X2 n=1 Tax=Amaranthus tricolor TaxID=29722 RepID=UPI00258B8366|nr:DNA-binding protein BIN4 isoform X2 [Amaranthus tricolor]